MHLFLYCMERRTWLGHGSRMSSNSRASASSSSSPTLPPCSSALVEAWQRGLTLGWRSRRWLKLGPNFDFPILLPSLSVLCSDSETGHREIVLSLIPFTFCFKLLRYYFRYLSSLFLFSPLFHVRFVLSWHMLHYEQEWNHDQNFVHIGQMDWPVKEFQLYQSHLL